MSCSSWRAWGAGGQAPALGRGPNTGAAVRVGTAGVLGRCLDITKERSAVWRRCRERRPQGPGGHPCRREEQRSPARFSGSQYLEWMSPAASPAPGSAGGLIAARLRDSVWESVETTGPVFRCRRIAMPSRPWLTLFALSIQALGHHLLELRRPPLFGRPCGEGPGPTFGGKSAPPRSASGLAASRRCV